jgi:hypothetical protein
MGVLGLAKSLLGKVGAGPGALIKSGPGLVAQSPGGLAKRLGSFAEVSRGLATGGGLIPSLTPTSTETFTITVWGNAKASRRDLFFIAYAIAKGRSYRTLLNNLPANIVPNWLTQLQTSFNRWNARIAAATGGFISLPQNPTALLEAFAAQWEFVVQEDLYNPVIRLEYSFKTNAVYQPRLFYMATGDAVTQSIAPSASDIIAGNYIPAANALKVYGFGANQNPTTWANDFQLNVGGTPLPTFQPTDQVYPPNSGGTRGTSLAELFVAALQPPCTTPPRPGTTETSLTSR